MKKMTRKTYEILIVEDDRATRILLDNFFGTKGFSSHSVGTGEKAWAELKEIKPQLILIDILLPGMNGITLCRKIKSTNRFESIPVYLISAVPEDEVKSNFDDSKADGYLLKPFDFEIFDSLLEDLNN
jgi:DNA-binding response OmpR family regulator